jgi:hypothetical protein
LDINPSSEEIDKLQMALYLLAGLISNGDKPEKDTLDEILVKVGINDLITAHSVLERACLLLERARNDYQETEKDIIIAELEKLGFRKAPAALAYMEAKENRSKEQEIFPIDPQRLDFGILKPGMEETKSIKVTGRIIKDVIFSNPDKLIYQGSFSTINEGKRYKLKDAEIFIEMKLHSMNHTNSFIILKLQGSSGGCSWQDEMVIQTDKGNIVIPITAEWRMLKEDTIVKKVTQDPPLQSRCPNCGNKTQKKTLFFSKSQHKYKCILCEKEFPFPDESVNHR